MTTTNILSAKKAISGEKAYCDQKHFGKDVFCASLSLNNNICLSLYVDWALNPLLPDQDQGKVSIPCTITCLLPDQGQGKVGWEQLQRGQTHIWWGIDNQSLFMVIAFCSIYIIFMVFAFCSNDSSSILLIAILFNK